MELANQWRLQYMSWEYKRIISLDEYFQIWWTGVIQSFADWKMLTCSSTIFFRKRGEESMLTGYHPLGRPSILLSQAWKSWIATSIVGHVGILGPWGVVWVTELGKGWSRKSHKVAEPSHFVVSFLDHQMVIKWSFLPFLQAWRSTMKMPSPTSSAGFRWEHPRIVVPSPPSRDPNIQI